MAATASYDLSGDGEGPKVMDDNHCDGRQQHL